MSNEEQLKQEIIERSVSDDWETARQEWEFDEIYESSEPDTCLCGHYPIKELCILKNIKNKKLATVGNVCVKKFLGLSSDKIFRAIKKVKEDKEKSLNIEAIQHAKNKRWISDEELSFLSGTIRKRDLSVKQLEWRKSINRKILFKWTLASKTQHRQRIKTTANT